MRMRPLVTFYPMIFLVFLIVNSPVFSETKLQLPGGIVVECEETLSFDKPEGKHNLEYEWVASESMYKLALFEGDKDQSPSERHPHKNRSGVGFVHILSTGSSEADVTSRTAQNRGCLDVVLVEGRRKETLNLRKVQLPFKFNAELLNEDDERACTNTKTDTGKFFLKGVGRQCVHFHCPALVRDDIALCDLKVMDRNKTKIFSPMKLAGDRCSDAFSAVIIRFKPKCPFYPTEYFIQLLDTEKVKQNEDVLREMNTLFADTQKFHEMSKTFLPLRDLTLENELVKKVPRGLYYPVWLMGYVFKGTPWDTGKIFQSYSELPAEGGAAVEKKLERKLRLISNFENKIWNTGLVSGTYYCGDHHVYEYLNGIFGMFSHTNAIQVQLNTSGSLAQGNLGRLILNILHADCTNFEDDSSVASTETEDSEGDSDSDSDTDTQPGPGVIVTSGGTDSIITALRAYRNKAKTRGIAKPVIIIPSTAHAAFERGCDDIEVVTVDVEQKGENASFKVRVDLVEDALKKHEGRVAAIVGSAFNYPHGVMDDIGELSELALKYDVGLHVDACLGGFVLHFLQELRTLQTQRVKYTDWVRKNPKRRVDIPDIPLIPDFDFKLKGVTSISIDTHKYGNSIKGSSVVAFRSKSLLFQQNYCKLKWTGGVYVSTNSQGSVGVGHYMAPLVAMLITGKDKYMEQAGNYYGLTQQAAAAIRRHDELDVIGNPFTVVAFRAKEEKDFDIGHVIDYMTLAIDKSELAARQDALDNEYERLDSDRASWKKICCCGHPANKKLRAWKLNTLQNPAGAHFCMTGPQVVNKGFLSAFKKDLDAAVKYATRIHSTGKKPNASSFYGLSQKGIDLGSGVLKKAFAYAGKSFLESSTEVSLDAIIKEFEVDMCHVVGDELGLHSLRENRCWGKPVRPFLK